MTELLKRKGPTAIEVLQEMARRPNYTPTVQVEAWRTADGMVYLPYKKHAIATAFAELIGRPDGGIPPDKIEVIERIGFVVEEPSGTVIPYQPSTFSEHKAKEVA